METITTNTITNTILSQTSNEIKSEIKQKRHSEKIDWLIALQILSQIENLNSDLTPAAIFKTIGLSPSSLSEAKTSGECRLVTYYALLGLRAEIEIQKFPQQSFTFDELAMLFAGILQLRNEPEAKNLIKKLAKMLT